ncbi:hypothetical protein Ahy_A07g032550 [Arachis hypogaea]|uniref:Exocyst subunit Exo70 family protein n=1 Tax=Arachis hypogaea TaxID=3818 RepID=A0A445C741_ARAHY|nr:hypothetical protein Ahy_A07g032550 [Arachis hypogaea]
MKKLHQDNWRLAWELQNHLNRYLTDEIDKIPEETLNDHNFLVDEISPQVLLELHKNANLMILGQRERDCVDEYINSQIHFLEMCQSELRLDIFQLQQKENINEEEIIKKWIKLSSIAMRILFPNERRLCDRAFNISSISDNCFMQICTKLTKDLLSFADGVADRSQGQSGYLPNILQVLNALNDQIIPAFNSLFSIQSNTSLGSETITVVNRLRLAIRDQHFKGLEDLICCDERPIPRRGKTHKLTVEVMNRLRDAFQDRDILEPILRDYPKVLVSEGMSSVSAHVAWIIELLETHLEAKSNICWDGALGCFFLMTNYLEDYQRSSWDTVLGFLKLDNGNLTAESMTEKLSLFNEHFYRIWHDQITWFDGGFETELREEIIESVCKILVPAYENFVAVFRDVLPEHADDYILYSASKFNDAFYGFFKGFDWY